MIARRLRLSAPLALWLVAGCGHAPEEDRSSHEAVRQDAVANELEAEHALEADSRDQALTNEVDALEQRVTALEGDITNRSTTEARLGKLETQIYGAGTPPANSSVPAAGPGSPARKAPGLTLHLSPSDEDTTKRDP